MSPVEQGPSESFEPVEFANQAADAGIKGIEAFLAQTDTEARHILIVIDLKPDTMPDPTAANATLAGQGYSGAEELFEELLDHARETGEGLGITVRIMTGPEGVGGQG